MSRFIRGLVFALLTACGSSASIDLSGLEQGAGSGAGSAEVGAGYSRPATPADLPDGFPFAADVGPESVSGSGAAPALSALCEAGAPGRWEEPCRAALCERCGSNADCADGEACIDGVCLPASLPEATLTVLPERSSQLFGAPARLRNFWATVTREGASERRYFDVLRNTPTDTKVSFAVYRQVVPPSGIPLPEGSGDLVLEERWVGGFADGSLLREALALETAAALTEQPVAQGQHRLVTVNGATYGAMFTYPVVDDAVLRASGRETDAPRFVPAGSGEVFAAGGGALVPLPDGRYEEAFVSESTASDDFAPLAGLVDGAIAVDASSQAAEPSTGSCAVRRVLDVDAYLEGLALLALLGDGGHARSNYRVSLQPRNGIAGRWQVWYESFALSFGCRWNDVEDIGLCGEMDATENPYIGMVEDGSNGAVFPPTGYYNLLTDVVLRDPELEAGFMARICSMLDSVFWRELLPKRAAGLGRLLEPAMADDPRDRVDGAAGYRAAVAEVLAYHAERTRLLRSQFLCY